MNQGDCSFMADSVAVFFDYIRIEGWFNSLTDTLASVELRSPKLPASVFGIVGLPHAGVAESLGPNKGFRVQAIVEGPKFPRDFALTFRTAQGREIHVEIREFCREREGIFRDRSLMRRFTTAIAATPGAKLLDIGGRARSGLDRRELFKSAECTVLDILPGETVDVVGDAHELTTLFPPASFDAVFSASVFEHLLMPWVVARQMAQILRPGGLAFVFSHQTIGMHDVPWDFWRFSDTAWSALFNQATGFEIIGRAMDNPQYVIPHVWRPERGLMLESATGYRTCSVLARKISEPAPLSDTVDIASIISTSYPQTEELPPLFFYKPSLWQRLKAKF